MNRLSVMLLLETASCFLSFGQTIAYHIFDYRGEPVVTAWNVPKQKAYKKGWFIEEKTDSLNRVVQLLFFYNNMNKRACIDDPDRITFSYPNDTTIIVQDLFAEKVDDETIKMCCEFLYFQYILTKQKDEFLITTDLQIDTIRYWSYMVHHHKADSIDARAWVRHFADSLSHHKSSMEGNHRDTVVPFYNFSFFKDGSKLPVTVSINANPNYSDCNANGTKKSPRITTGY